MGILLCGGITVLITATLIFLWLYAKHKILAFVTGYGIILLTWLATIIWVYGGCLECSNAYPMDDNLCCEWTGVGLMIYSVMALVIAIIFSIFVYANYQAEKDREKSEHDKQM